MSPTAFLQRLEPCLKRSTISLLLEEGQLDMRLPLERASLANERLVSRWSERAAWSNKEHEQKAAQER